MLLSLTMSIFVWFPEKWVFSILDPPSIYAPTHDPLILRSSIVASPARHALATKPSNDNSQLNRLLYPPYTDKSKRDA